MGAERFRTDMLARRFRLDPMIVRRIAQSEGVELEDSLTADPPSDANLDKTDPILLARVDLVSKRSRKE